MITTPMFPDKMNQKGEQMMEEKIMEVLRRMETDLKESQLQELKNTLYIVFSGCEISSNNSLRSVEDDWKNDMEDFLMSKILCGMAKKTVDRYCYELQRMLQYINKSVRNVTSGDISGYMQAYKKIRGICNQTLKNVRAIYSSFFSWLRDRGRIQKNPMVFVEGIKVEKKIK